MYLAVSSTRVLFWLFVCLINKRKQLQLTSAEKKLITRKSGHRINGSLENQPPEKIKGDNI